MVNLGTSRNDRNQIHTVLSILIPPMYVNVSAGIKTRLPVEATNAQNCTFSFKISTARRYKV